MNAGFIAIEKSREDILDGFRLLSEEILQENFTENKYRKFALDSLKSYLRKLAGHGKWLSRVERYLYKGKIY